MHYRFLFLILFLAEFSDCKASEYDIPPSIRFTCSREDTSSEIVYYFKKPVVSVDNYPILILCEGSSSKEGLRSIMFMFKYFEEQVTALDVGFITVEQWGIDGNHEGVRPDILTFLLC